jgi:hypothetical protein
MKPLKHIRYFLVNGEVKWVLSFRRYSIKEAEEAIRVYYPDAEVKFITHKEVKQKYKR